MKKLLFNLKMILLVLATGLISMNAFGQLQVGNSGFENWDNVGTSSEEPENWNSFKTAQGSLSGQGAKQVERSTDAHSGTYSARIWSRSVFGIVANGNMTLGRVNMGSITPTGSSNYNFTKRDDANFNQPFTGKPDSLVVWVKFNPITSTDLARVSATIHDDYDYRDPEDAGATPHVVAKAILNYGSTNDQWQRLSIPFDYVGPATTPAYILITFTTSATPGGGSANDEVFIDDLEMIYNPNTVEVAPLIAQNIYTNENGTALTATETPNAGSTVTSRQWKYAANPGGPYTNDILGETGTSYTPNFATAGTYYVVCETDFDGDVVTSNEVQVNVTETTVVVAPSATQNVFENQPGNTLTVTETPTADSREWKWSTTSGSGYTSFTTLETGTTYTPQFASAGTYYVVCESTINGVTVTSNEVEVIVTVAVSNSVAISPNSIQTLIENQSGATITASENPTAADTREWKWSTTSGSGYISFITVETGTTYTPQFADVGTYYIICESDFAGDIQVSNEIQIDVIEFTVSIDPSAAQTLIENEVGNTLTVTEALSADSREWKYSETQGSGYVSFTTAEIGTTYNPVFANAGTYYVVVESTVDGITVTSNEVQIEVVEFTAVIEPSTTQNLLENEQGTELEVTETVLADSREWKYTETSGSNYVSFTPAETGTTYTPQFATAGTYYVVVESTIGSITTTSNEVTILVEEDELSIKSDDMTTYTVYTDGKDILVDLSDVELKDATITVLSTEGALVAKQSLKSNQKNTVQLSVPTGIYFFAISSGKHFQQGKVVIK